MYPERIDLFTAEGRAVHLQKTVQTTRIFEVVDVGVGTARFTSEQSARAFFNYLTEDRPLAKATAQSPVPSIGAIPGVLVYYDYGHWHISLKSRAEEDQLIHISYHSLFSLNSPADPLRIGYSNLERDRRGITTWAEGLWSRDLKFVFPMTPPATEGTTNLNRWGGTEFLPYAEAVLAHDLGLVEASDAEAAPAPGVRSVRLRGGTVLFVRRSTPLGTARSADGAWRLWLGDGEGWRPASGPSDALWKAVAPVCFGTPLDELTEWLPGERPVAAEWEHLDGAGTPIPPDPKAKGEVLMMALVAGEVMSFLDNDIPAEDDREVFDAWTVYICT